MPPENHRVILDNRVVISIDHRATGDVAAFAVNSPRETAGDGAATPNRSRATAADAHANVPGAATA